MIKKISFILATVFGAGYFPVAPGTVGSLVTLPMVWYLSKRYGLEGVWALVLMAYILGILSLRVVLRHTKHDPSFVVIDEVAGQAITFVLVPELLNVWWAYLAGFILFRFFDIVKMGPVKWADTKIEDETGVMLDDIFAGLASAFILWMVARFLVPGLDQ